MSRLARTRLLIVLAVAALAGSVWFGGHAQRLAADRAVHELAASDATLESMLAQEIALREYLITRREPTLVGFDAAGRRLSRALDRSRAGVSAGESAEGGLVRAEAGITRRWRRAANAAIAAV